MTLEGPAGQWREAGDTASLRRMPSLRLLKVAIVLIGEWVAFLDSDYVWFSALRQH